MIKAHALVLSTDDPKHKVTSLRVGFACLLFIPQQFALLLQRIARLQSMYALRLWKTGLRRLPARPGRNTRCRLRVDDVFPCSPRLRPRTPTPAARNRPSFRARGSLARVDTSHD